MKPETYCPICQRQVIKVLNAQYLYCEECQLAVRAMESRLSISQTRELFSSSWARAHSSGNWTRHKAREILKVVQSLSGVKSIVDIGCGSGVLVDMLAKVGYESVGLDNSLEAIQFARANCEGEYVCQEVGEVSGEYDMAVMSHLLEHIENPIRFLEQASSLLKVGGYLYIAVPNLNFYDDASFWRRHVDRTLLAESHITGISEYSLRLILAQAGYKARWIKTQTTDTTLLDKLALCLLRKFQGDEAAPENGRVRSVYEYIAYSILFRVLLCAPNKIISRGGRGMELAALVCKRGK